MAEKFVGLQAKLNRTFQYLGRQIGVGRHRLPKVGVATRIIAGMTVIRDGK